MLNEYSIGDSRELLKQVDSNSVDLIYIDPPYCTGRDFYHFDDRFKSSADYRELLMRPLLTECHRILSDVGNVVVHVEPKVSHHIRIVMDDVFGENRFKNEIVWISGGNHKSKKQLQRNHDTIIVYQKGKESIYNPEHKEYDAETIRKAKYCPYHKKKYNTSALVNRQPNVVSRPNLGMNGMDMIYSGIFQKRGCRSYMMIIDLSILLILVFQELRSFWMKWMVFQLKMYGTILNRFKV